jgi:PAS domain S-box-containing protein
MSKKILILEDEVQLAYILKQALEFHDYQVYFTESIADAKTYASENPIDCVVSDYYLPEGSGEELFYFLKENSIEVPFMFMTGNPSLDFAVRFMKDGGAEYIAKPFSLNDFVNKVKAVIHKFENTKSKEKLIDALQDKLAERIKEVTIFQDIYNATGDGIMIIGVNRKIVKVNRALREMTGFSYDGNPLIDNVIKPAQDDKYLIDNIWRSLEENGQWKGELALLNNSGSEWDAYATFSKIEDESKQIFAYVGIIKNVTEIKQMEKSLLVSLQKTNSAQEAIIFGLAKLAEYKDPSTGAHLERIRSYCQLIASHLQNHPLYSEQITAEFTTALYLTAPLHDIGKVGIPDKILLKEGQLSEEEYELMKEHPLKGAEILRAIGANYGGIDYLKIGIDIALAHHEKWDGSGYPNGLKGNEIPLAARILAVADVYDALTSKRVYKSAFSHKDSMEILQQGRGNHFDPEILDIFVSIGDESRKIKASFETSQL